MHSITLRLVFAAISVALVVTPAVSTGSTNEYRVAVPTCPSVHEHGLYLKRMLRFTHRGGDYRASRWHHKMASRANRMRACQRHAGHVRMYWTMRRAFKHRLVVWRFHRYIDRITPYGEWAIPSYVVGCETGGTYSYTIWNHGSTSPERASGAYQILGKTWRGFGGLRYARYAADAPDWAQHIVASRIRRGQGLGAWSCA